MAIRFDVAADFAIGSVNIGGAGHVNFSLGGWFWFESWTNQSNKCLFGAGHSGNGRAIYAGTNAAFPDPQLNCGDSQSGITGTGISPRPSTGVWYYLELSSPNTTGGTLTLRVSALGSNDIYSTTRTNGVEPSVQAERVQVNRAAVGDAAGFTQGVRVAYFRGYAGPTPSDAAFLSRKADTTGAGALFFWPLATNSDGSDLTGNGITATLNGTLTTEDSPVLATDQNESGGSVSEVDVLSFGTGVAAEAASGGSVSTVAVGVSGAGVGAEIVTGGAVSTVSVASAGAGSAAEAVSGGSTAMVLVIASGEGQGPASESGGSVARVNVSASGAGLVTLQIVGGSVARVLVTATGGAGSSMRLLDDGAGRFLNDASGRTLRQVA